MIHYAVQVVSAGVGTGVSVGMVLAKFKQEWQACEYAMKARRFWPWRACELRVAKEESGEGERKLRLVA